MTDSGERGKPWGLRFTRLGFVGFGVLLLAFLLTAVSMGNGVHCPSCDRHHLTDAQFEFWQRYFLMKDGVYLAATVLLAAAIPLAKPRRWPFALGLLIVFFAWSLTPR